MTRHVQELQEQVETLELEFRRFEHATLERFHDLDLQLISVREAQARNRETIRAEIATAVAELRVRYAEERGRGERRHLGEGD